jgi:Glutathione S-transferase, N-terminal domain
MLELYNAPVSTCSQRVRMALSEKGLDWTDRRVSLRDGEQVQPAYLAINPNGVVPTLVHDGNVVGDSSVILEYLEDVFPQNPLRPANPLALARMRMWRQYIDEVPTPATRVPSFHASFGNGLRKMTAEARAVAAAQRPLRKHMLLKIGPDGFSARDLGVWRHVHDCRHQHATNRGSDGGSRLPAFVAGQAPGGQLVQHRPKAQVIR